MVDKICEILTNKIKKENQELSEERLEIINYGLQLIIGEIPKMFLAIILALIFGSVKYVLLTLLILIPYRGFSGGFHLKTHIGCFVCTTVLYSLPGIIGRFYIIDSRYKLITIIGTLIFGIIMISLYAPADTENLPILTKKERKIKKVLSYIILGIAMILAYILKEDLSSIIIYTIILQTINITRMAYKLSNCKYGYINYKQGNLEI